MPSMPDLTGTVRVEWHADPAQTPEQPGEAPSYPQNGDTNQMNVGASPHPEDGLKAHSTADRWRLRIGNSAVVVIEMYEAALSKIQRYNVHVEIGRADAGTTMVALADAARTYDDAYFAGVNLARELVNAFGIIDNAEALVQGATHRAEMRLRQGWETK